MQFSSEPEYLSFGDALFLYLERDGTPLNIASVAIFDGNMTLQELTGYIQSKLPLIPRYLQKVVMAPFNLGLPRWEFDPDFNIGNHIREITLKRGTEHELKAVAGKILSTTLNRQHPLWQLTLIHRLKDDQTGLLVRVHHCLADGLSGIGLLNILLDTKPDVPRIVKRKIHIPVPQRTPESIFLEPALQFWFSSVQRVLTAGNHLPTIAKRVTGFAGKTSVSAPPGTNGAMPTMEDVSRLLPELTGLPDRLPFNVLCQGPQNFEWTHVPFSKVKAIKDKTGTKINDVILAIFTSAFRRYSEFLGVNVKGRMLRIVVPVSTRQETTANDLGNHITFTPVSTPLGIRDPRKLLAAVNERMNFVKTAGVAELVGFAGNLMGTIPSPLQSVLASALSELPLSVCNTICTNVPGPQVPLYMIGHKMLCAFPYVPIGGEMGLNCAVLSYNGTAFFGFTGDAKAAPKLELMPAFVDATVQDFERVFGTRPRKPRKRRVSVKPAHMEVPKVLETVPSRAAPEITEEEPLRAEAATVGAA
jgi:diacylglycerol O-acyltransferase